MRSGCRDHNMKERANVADMESFVSDVTFFKVKYNKRYRMHDVGGRIPHVGGDILMYSKSHLVWRVSLS